jgi:esterase/lipase
MRDVILLHGAIGAADQMEPLAISLREKGFTVHTFSFSGHGGIPFNTSFGIGTFAAELYQFIIAKNLEQPDIFGYSMGGYVALFLAAEKSQLIGKIATLATKFDWTPDGAVKEAAMLHPETILDKVPRFAETLQQRHGSDQWTVLLEKTATMMKELGGQPLLDNTIYATIPTPVLLGVGDRDNMVSLDETRAVFQALPNASLYVLPATRHPVEGAPIGLLSEVLAGFFK